MAQTVINLLAGILVIGTALSVWRHDAWWVRAWDFPRAQILVFGLALLAADLAVRADRGVVGKIIAGLLVVSLALQVWRIFPYTPMATKQSLQVTDPAPANQVSLMVSNVLMDNRHADTLLDLIAQKRPDLFLAAETDAWWAETLSALRDDYPYRIEKPIDNTYGLILYSKRELIQPEIRFLMHDDVPSFHGHVRLDNGRAVRFHFLHPKPPYPSESISTTTRDAEILIVGRKVGSDHQPTIVAGDLNDVAWSHTTRLFQRLSGMLDPRIGRGLFSTFHADIPLLRWPLDHVFHTDHFQLVTLERLPSIGSDHFPIYVALSLEPKAPIEQEAPEPNEGDREEAAEKIEAGIEASLEEEEQQEQGEQPERTEQNDSPPGSSS